MLKAIQPINPTQEKRPLFLVWGIRYNKSCVLKLFILLQDTLQIVHDNYHHQTYYYKSSLLFYSNIGSKPECFVWIFIVRS